MRADIRQALDRSPSLSNGRAIQLALDGRTVVLQGTVANARERRIAELVTRMGRGVRDVRNELQVAPSAPTTEEE
jgi:osmotically-inducible protein OsmY